MPNSCSAVRVLTSGSRSIHGNIALLVFQLPGIEAFVVLKFRIVVAFVEVLEDRREDLGRLFREKYPLAGRF